jgi:hypothetical protein
LQNGVVEGRHDLRARHDLQDAPRPRGRGPQRVRGVARVVAVVAATLSALVLMAATAVPLRNVLVPPPVALAELPPVYAVSDSPITPEDNLAFGEPWRPECPVPLEDLRLLRLRYRDFGGVVRDGSIIVHAEWAFGIGETFRRLFEAGYPVEYLHVPGATGADVPLPPVPNGTYGFACRRMVGSSQWSEHAYGRAVDLNPLQNPYVDARGRVVPEAGAAYVDRTNVVPGMIVPGDDAVRAFADITWSWGGDWRSPRDWMHFSATGR